MGAVRCAATRLGGSLLQRRQAAVADEGRRFAPSRLVRSRQLSSEHAPKIPKEEELFEKPYHQSLANLRKTIREVEEYQKITMRVQAVKSLMVGSAKLTVFCIVVAAAFDGNGVEAKAVTKENSDRKMRTKDDGPRMFSV